jgi:hypothetical protein
MNKTAVAITSIIVGGIIIIAGLYFTFGTKFVLAPTSSGEVPSPSTSVQGKAQSTQPNVKTTKEASGKVLLVNNKFVLQGDSKYPNGLTVKNSLNSKLHAILMLYVNNKNAVKISGIVKSWYPNEMIVLLVDGKMVLTEAEAMDTTPRTVSTGQSFAEFYATLSASQKECISTALGASTVQKWQDNPEIQPSPDDLRRINACTE